MLNSFGLNSAPLNGSVIKYVLGAALLVAGGSLTASPENTTQGFATISATSGTQAAGVRNVLGRATASSGTNLAAQGVIAITSSASLTSRSTLRGTYTDAYGQSQSGFSAEGTKIQSGAGTAAGNTVLAAAGTRMAGTTVALQGTGTLTPDPSVKRYGQTTSEREGNPGPLSSTVKFVADGLRLAQVGALGETTSLFTAAAPIQIHGGAATFVTGSRVYALAATDGCYSQAFSTLSAKPTLIHGGAAYMGGRLQALADALALTPAQPARVDMVSDFKADGRIGLRGEGALTAQTRLQALPRLAELGKATSIATSDATAAPWVYRAAYAQVDMTSSATAIGMKVQPGAATAASIGALSANGIANPSTPAPPGRRMHVQAQSRTMRAQPQNRTMRVT